MALVKIYKKDNSITLEKDGSGGLYYGSEIDIYWYDELESVNISYREKNTGVVSYQEILNESGLQAAATYELTKDYLRDVMSPCECGGDSGAVEWGAITGILSNQTDLINEFETKQPIFNGVIVVNTSNVDTTLGGIIDSSKQYFLDEFVDIGSTQIDLSGGKILNLKGHDFEISGLYSSEDNYTMIIGADAGDLLGIDFKIEISGLNSQVFDVTSNTGFNAYEYVRVNYINCTSLGEMINYRQGLETGTGRFGGSPSLTLSGTWAGGFRITTSIVRELSAGMTEPLFKAGAGFNMNSRFLTDLNLDLPALASFIDFSDSNFVNPSTLILNDCIITRNGVTNPNDSNITPNISASNLSSYWKLNKGVINTFVGGGLTITSEVTTTIGGGNQGVFFDIEGVYSSSDLQHFDAPQNGQLRHLGDNPREFKLFASLIIDSSQNQEVDVKVVVWDDSSSSFIDYKTVRRVINNLQGGRDVAYFTFSDNILLDSNDYVKLMVANATGTQNITAESGSEFIIEER